MIILVLSTPRSGSHYFSESLLEQWPDAVVAHEALSRAAQSIYLHRKGTMDHSVKYFVPGCYHHNIVDRQVAEVFRPRIYAESFFQNFVSSISDTGTYIVHEHVSLLPDKWREQLIGISDEVYYLTRDRREQLASRIIAGYTGVYLIADNYMLVHGNTDNMSKYHSDSFQESITSAEQIEQLLATYQSCDQLMLTSGAKIVQYETVLNKPSTMKKLFASSFSRLCPQDQMLIEYTLLNCD